MHVLGIDTATHRASVAVVADGVLLAEETVESRSHAAALVPLIDRVLQDAGCTIAAVGAIAVSAGPGSFTGLRVGLSVAKGFTCATGVPVVPIPTLEALAYVAPTAAGAVCPLLDARKGELYAACFAWSGDRWQPRFAACLLRPDRLAALLPSPCTILGDAVVRYGDFLVEHLGDRVTLLPWPEYGPRGSVVARLAAARIQNGTAIDSQAVEPFYVRPSDAELRLA